jgi:glycosyl transferase family 25
MQPFPLYLINLDRSPDRLAFMQAQFARLGIVYERVVAQDGTASLGEEWRWQFRGAPLSAGKIGCYVSQLMALQRLIAASAPWGIVLQDDVTLDEDFLKVAEAAIRAAPGADLIHLCTNWKERPKKIARLSEGRWLARHRRLPVGAGALAFSRAGAMKLLEAQHRQRTFDLELRYGFLHGLDIYGVTPSPAAQRENFVSCIGPHGAEDALQRKRWAPSLADRIHGWLYVWRKLREHPIKAPHLLVTDTSLRIFH